MKPTTGKEQLETILRGGVPDAIPHFEMNFFLYKEMFGMDIAPIVDAPYGSAAARIDAFESFYTEVAARCIDEFGWAAVPPWYYEDEPHAIRRLKKELGDRALIYSFSHEGVIWMPDGAGYEVLSVRMFEDPDGMHEEARRKVAYTKERTLRQRDAGVDFIIQNTDFGLNTGPFISPKHFRTFCTPYMAELVAFMHDLDIPVIMHSDGNLNSILDQITSTGVDGYQSVDPQGFMDIKAVRETYPDWILMGNVNCAMMQDIDEEAIRGSVRYCMEYGGIGKRFIFSTSNCIFPGMPPESYRIMLDEYHRCIDRAMAISAIRNN